MALIDCPECGREISSSAAACPDCAYPVSSGSRGVTQPVAVEPSKEQWWKTALPLGARLLIGFILLVVGLEGNETSGVIGGLIVGGSVIPAWYRHKIDRLRAGRGGAELAARLEQQMREMAVLHRDEIARLEQAQAGQIAELEERIDFTERLLTKPRE